MTITLIYIILALLTAICIARYPDRKWADREWISFLILATLFWPAFWLYVAVVKAKAKAL